ncbi:MAG: FHA domain-containing protein [Synechococcaceae cyanobacterium]|nr:FHA domain-containing protein [Synechococcaceae cyanobacterium]
MSIHPQLVLRQDPHKVAPLDPGAPLTIGRARNNKLCLASWEAVAPHHAVVRFSPEHGWLVCDWGSSLGTYCRGRRVQRCLPLRDGDDITLGREGPVLVFQHRADVAVAPVSATPALATGALPSSSVDSATAMEQASAVAIPLRASPRSLSAPPATPNSGIAEPARRAQGSGGPSAAKPIGRRTPIQIAGREVPLAAIRCADVRSRPRHPHSFSWWVLACLAGLVLLPWAWLFWPWQIGALAAWILLGARKEHMLILTLRDGMAYRHRFVNRGTALAHRNGVRRAIGQPLDA